MKESAIDVASALMIAGILISLIAFFLSQYDYWKRWIYEYKITFLKSSSSKDIKEITNKIENDNFSIIRNKNRFSLGFIITTHILGVLGFSMIFISNYIGTTN